MAEKWYIAVLVLASEIEGVENYEPLSDIQYRLISSSDPEDAYTSALKLGESEVHTYKNDKGEVVKWQFIGLRDLRELDESEIGHGVEVYSETKRSNPKDEVVTKDQLSVFWYESNKHRKASDILGD